MARGMGWALLNREDNYLAELQTMNKPSFCVTVDQEEDQSGEPLSTSVMGVGSRYYEGRDRNQHVLRTGNSCESALHSRFKPSFLFS